MQDTVFKHSMMKLGSILMIAGIGAVVIGLTALMGGPYLIKHTVIFIGVLVFITGLVLFNCWHDKLYKHCPYCLKTVKREAVVCPMCNRELNKAEMEVQNE